MLVRLLSDLLPLLCITFAPAGRGPINVSNISRATDRVYLLPLKVNCTYWLPFLFRCWISLLAPQSREQYSYDPVGCSHTSLAVVAANMGKSGCVLGDVIVLFFHKFQHA